MTGHAGDTVIELHEVAGLRCLAGHGPASVSPWLRDEVVIAATLDEQIPIAIAYPVKGPACQACGARLSREAVARRSQDHELELDGGAKQRVRVTGPYVECGACKCWQLYYRDGGGELVAAIRSALDCR